MCAIRHELVIRFRDGSTDVEIDRIIYLVKRMALKLPEVREIAFNRNHAAGYSQAIMMVTLDDEVALERFTAHPVYDSILRFVAPMIEDISADDYVVRDT
jgi:hypothetical protein